MTIIECEHCGPTRVAPHDINCPKRQPEAEVYGKTYPFRVDGEQMASLPHPIGYTDIPRAYTHPLLDPNYLMDFPRTLESIEQQKWANLAETAKAAPMITKDTNPEMFEPIPVPAEHVTFKGRHGAECRCGYNPRLTHPDAGRGELYALVGQHIREVRP
jgi:hypothetical protein